MKKRRHDKEIIHSFYRTIGRILVVLKCKPFHSEKEYNEFLKSIFKEFEKAEGMNRNRLETDYNLK